MRPEFMKAAIILFMTLVLGAANVLAQEATLTGEKEQRARALFQELRCVVCQNQSIDNSDADVARDLRVIVREQITAGKSDSEIRSFLVSRYGEFVLLKPAFGLHTLILWLMPLLLLAAGGLIILRLRNGSSTAPLSADEQEQLSRIVDTDTVGHEK